MFNRREKIIKKDGSKPSELEEEVAKRLHQIELENMELKKELSIILITSAQMVDYEDADKTPAQYLLVRILHRSLGAFKKAGYKVVEQLEAHYEKPVMIVANRTIISPSGTHPIISSVLYSSTFSSHILTPFLSNSQAPPIADETKIKDLDRSPQGDPRRRGKSQSLDINLPFKPVWETECLLVCFSNFRLTLFFINML